MSLVAAAAAAAGGVLAIQIMSEVMVFHLPRWLLASVRELCNLPSMLLLTTIRLLQCRNPIQAYQCSPFAICELTMLLYSRRGLNCSSPRDKEDNSETALNSNLVHLSAIICLDNLDTIFFEIDNPTICESLITEIYSIITNSFWCLFCCCLYVFHNFLCWYFPSTLCCWWCERWWTRNLKLLFLREHWEDDGNDSSPDTWEIYFFIFFFFLWNFVLLYSLRLSSHWDIVRGISHSRKLTFWLNYTSLGIYSS